MRLFLLSILCLFFISNSSFAQKAKFSVSMGVGFVPDYNDSKMRNQEYIGYRKILQNDTLAQQISFKSTVTHKHNYYSALRFYLNGLADFKLTERLTIGTGIGIQYNHFVVTDGFSVDNIVETILDTLGASRLPSYFNAPFVSSCDSFVLSRTISRFDPNYKVVDLVIPLTAKYELSSGLAVVLGGSLKTPIFTNKEYYSTSTRTEVHDDKTICYQERWIFHDKSGSELNLLRFSVLGGIDYRLQKRIDLSIRVETDLKGYFHSDELNDVRFSQTKSFKSSAITLGLKYHFGVSEQ